jgi:hypothetical protein
MDAPQIDLSKTVQDLRESLGERHPNIWSLVTLGGVAPNLGKLMAAAEAGDPELRTMVLDLCAFYCIEATEVPSKREP